MEYKFSTCRGRAGLGHWVAVKMTNELSVHSRTKEGVLLKKEIFLLTTVDKNGMKRISEMMKSLNKNDAEEGDLCRML